MRPTLQKSLLPIILSSQTAYCWWCFYKAQFLPYDNNYGLIIHGWLVSLLTLIILTIIWFKKIETIKVNALTSIIWFVAGSPLTYLIAAIYYGEIFKASLVN